MRFLLDTHVLLWALANPKRLPEPVFDLIETTGNEILFSAASIWEIAIKAQLLHVEFGVDAMTIIDAARATGFTELAVSTQHAAGVSNLPLHHKDPFDRMLISQAIMEPARLLTADRTLSAYSNDLVTLIA
jgi:PIN domain nuclease of toxin-antitoxin system